jgi:transposase
MKTQKSKQIELDENVKEYEPFLRVKKVKDKAYLYEVTQYYNCQTKKQWQTSKYIRKIHPQEDLDHLTKEPPTIQKNTASSSPKIQQLTNFGDAYLYHALVEELHLKKILLKCFSESMTHFLLLTVGYKLLSDGQAFHHMESWLETSDLPSFYPLSTSFHSASISKHLAQLGNDELDSMMRFFLHWSQYVHHEGESLLFDLTSFASQASELEEAEYGYSKDHSPYPQINMGLLVNQQQKLPLYYKVYPGSLKDVKTLHNMVEEIHMLSIPSVVIILDRGFYKEQHLLEMLQKNLSFIIPLSKIHRKLYDTIRTTHRETLESSSHWILVNGKPTFAASGSTTLPFQSPDKKKKEKEKEKAKDSKEEKEAKEEKNGKEEEEVISYPLYYSIYMDPERKQKEEQSFAIELFEAQKNLQEKDWNSLLEGQDKKEVWKEQAGMWKSYFTLEKEPKKNVYHVLQNTSAIDKHVQSLGITILLSSSPRDAETLLHQYRQRDHVEKVFDSCKNELKSLPLRVHQSDTMRGYFFVLFLEMIVHNYLLYKMKKGNVDPKFSAKRVLFELHKWKKALWHGKKCLLNEVTKLQETLYQQLGIVMPNL